MAESIRNGRILNTARFDKLFKVHRNRVYGFAFHYLNSSDRAADVTQDVFVRLWKNRDSVEEDRVLGWLLRVTRNACVDAIRKQKAYEKRVQTNSDIIMEKAGSDPLPDERVEASIFREHLQSALQTLDEPYRSIILLREIQEYKYEEISETLDIPLNTVKVYLHRARKAIRKELIEVMRYDYA